LPSRYNSPHDVISYRRRARRRESRRRRSQRSPGLEVGARFSGGRLDATIKAIETYYDRVSELENYRERGADDLDRLDAAVLAAGHVVVADRSIHARLHAAVETPW
jgi:hypothetical protein